MRTRGERDITDVQAVRERWPKDYVSRGNGPRQSASRHSLHLDSRRRLFQHHTHDVPAAEIVSSNRHLACSAHACQTGSRERHRRRCAACLPPRHRGCLQRQPSYRIHPKPRLGHASAVPVLSRHRAPFGPTIGFHILQRRARPLPPLRHGQTRLRPPTRPPPRSAADPQNRLRRRIPQPGHQGERVQARAAGGRRRIRSLMRKTLRERQSQPERVGGYFQHTDVRRIA